VPEHRIGLTLCGIDGVMNGELGSTLQAITFVDAEARLRACARWLRCSRR
jgi:protein subunit release factor A